MFLQLCTGRHKNRPLAFSLESSKLI